MYLFASHTFPFSHPVMKVTGLPGTQDKMPIKGVVQRETFHMDYQFQYNAKRQPEHCIPELTFVGGGCV